MVDPQRQEKCLKGQGMEKEYRERKYELSVTDSVSAILLIAGTTRKRLRISLTFSKKRSLKQSITFFKR